MILKAVYLLSSAAGLALLLVAAPSGALLTSTPERGKVERKANPQSTTVRTPMFVYLGGYHGGK